LGIPEKYPWQLHQAIESSFQPLETCVATECEFNGIKRFSAPFPRFSSLFARFDRISRYQAENPIILLYCSSEHFAAQTLSR
jgi:hypothetical protein